MNTPSTPTRQAAIDAFAALAQTTRVETMRLLLKRWPGGMTAGAIAECLGAPPSTMSAHFAVLARAGLIIARRESRSIHYSANTQAISDIVGFLVGECCDGRPELCGPIASVVAAAATCRPTAPPAAPARRRR